MWSFSSKLLGCAMLNLVVAGCTTDPSLQDAELQIVGGSTTTIDENPWQVYVTSRDVSCGGSILGPRWVLTAQHCVIDSADLQILAGVTDLRLAADGQRRTVDTVFLVPGYDGVVWNRDLALLHLSAPLDTSSSKVKPIALLAPQEASAVAPGRTVRVTGWGATSRDRGNYPNLLRTLDTEVMSNADAAALRDFPVIQNDEIAYNSAPGGIGSCAGDSGGPVTVNVNGVRKLASAVSWGPTKCGSVDEPDVGVRITSYHAWITARTQGRYALALTENNLSATPGQRILRTIDVPAGARALTVLTTRGTGDVDLAVRNGAAPTAQLYRCRSQGYSGANEPTVELCSIDNPAAGTWYVSLGTAGHGGVNLRAAVITP